MFLHSDHAVGQLKGLKSTDQFSAFRRKKKVTRKESFLYNIFHVSNFDLNGSNPIFQCVEHLPFPFTLAEVSCV